MRLENKVALITGASSGIGRETALLFAKEGAKVVVVDVSDAAGQETVNMITQSGGEHSIKRPTRIRRLSRLTSCLLSHRSWQPLRTSLMLKSS